MEAMTRLFAGTPFDIPPRCDRCGELEEECQCGPPPKQFTPPGEQTAKVRVDKRKHQRMMTVVWDLSADENDLADLLSKLKSACGAGGSIKNDQIEIQGDHLGRVKQELTTIGYRVKSI